MKENLNGIVIKTKNISLLRNFYRDVLELGHPVIDSNIWVEFQVSDGMSIILDASQYSSNVEGNLSWFYTVRDVDVALSRLKQYGYTPQIMEAEELGIKVYFFQDPEGNPFALRDSK